MLPNHGSASHLKRAGPSVVFIIVERWAVCIKANVGSLTIEIFGQGAGDQSRLVIQLSSGW